MSERMYLRCKRCNEEVLLAKSFTAAPGWRHGDFEFWRGTEGVDQRDKISAFVSKHSECARDQQTVMEWD